MSPAKKRAASTKQPSKKSVKKAGRKAGTATGPLVPQPHGGALWQGAPANPVAGPGRPPDTIRAAMRDLGATKGLPFLDDVLDGRIAVTLVGTCAQCGSESQPDIEWMKDLTKQVRASVDQRLKALEQAWKYGLGTKDEITVVSPEVMDRLTRQAAVLVEELDAPTAERVFARLTSEVWK